MSGIVELQNSEIANTVDRTLKTWEAEDLCQRIWAKDHTVWSSDPAEISNRLGWLDLPIAMQGEVDSLVAFGEEIRNEGFQHVLLLGMGGSSLAPEVFAKTLGSAQGFPELSVLDSTHPDAVLAVEDRLDLERTLFLVASKSGTTLETMSLFHTFWARTAAIASDPGRHFVAITDPGSALEVVATELRFRRVFAAPPTVGGRYSALSVFGMVPAALIGANISGLLDGAQMIHDRLSPQNGTLDNPGIVLGITLAKLAQEGINKITFLTSAEVEAFPAWIEQLIAESLGKEGKGVVPVYGEDPLVPGEYADDRVFVDLSLAEEDDATNEESIEALKAAGYPIIRAPLRSKTDLGAEMFRWEFATAVAGAVLEINPFNQPDVQLAKKLAREAMAETSRTDSTGQTGMVDVRDGEKLAKEIADWALPNPGDYLALQAYLAPSNEMHTALQSVRTMMATRLGVASTIGYGPRFLHSTGQLHKGGDNNGLFLQLVDEPSAKIGVPETAFTFDELIAAQAAGDKNALQQRGRRVLAVNLGKDALKGIEHLARAIE